MKKFFTFILVSAMALSMVACGDGKKKSSSKDNDSSKPDDKVTIEDNGNTEVEQNPVEMVFHPATSADTGAYATIKVSADIKMDDTSAWLGLCPEGKDYITELEADDVDVIWFNYADREEGEPYVYACDFSSVEDGTYALVVATSDDENVGYVVIQLSMTKAGEKLTFDYTNAKIKERPAK